MERPAERLRLACSLRGGWPVLPCEANIDLPFYVVPFLGGAQSSHELLEAVRIPWGELEPGQEVEGLAQVASMVQASRDRWEVFKADGDVVRALLENATALVLCELPPRLGLLDRNQRGACRCRPTKPLLARDQFVVLDTGDVTLVARDSAQDPVRIFDRARNRGSFKTLQTSRWS